MLVKMKQCHKYYGPLTRGPHPARPRTLLQVKQVVEMPADYFEKFLEPYGFAVPIPSVEADDREGVEAELGKHPVNVLRKMAQQLGAAEELSHLEGTGKNGAVKKVDLVTFLLRMDDQEGLAALITEQAAADN